MNSANQSRYVWESWLIAPSEVIVAKAYYSESYMSSTPEEDYEAAFLLRFRVLVVDGTKPMARAASLAMVFCCRCNSAVPNPRAAPAALLAVLSHMLIQGFFI
jgi:hypothetical protein